MNAKVFSSVSYKCLFQPWRLTVVPYHHQENLYSKKKGLLKVDCVHFHHWLVGTKSTPQNLTDWASIIGFKDISFPCTDSPPIILMEDSCLLIPIWEGFKEIIGPILL